jgi:hypothetical protein
LPRQELEGEKNSLEKIFLHSDEEIYTRVITKEYII